MNRIQFSANWSGLQSASRVQTEKRTPLLAKQNAQGKTDAFYMQTKTPGLIRKHSNAYKADKQCACQLACDLLSAKAADLLKVAEVLPSERKSLANSAHAVILGQRDAILRTKEVNVGQLEKARIAYETFSASLFSNKLKLPQAPLASHAQAVAAN